MPPNLQLPTLNLNLPDPQPIKDKIAALHEARERIRRIDQEEVTLSEKIAAYIASGDGDDSRLQQFAGYRVRLEMLPHIKKRAIQEAAAAGEPVLVTLAYFERKLTEQCQRERLAWLDHLEALLAPFEPGQATENVSYARSLAMKFRVVQVIPGSTEVLDAPALEKLRDENTSGGHYTQADLETWKAEHVESAVKRANGLFALLDAIKRRGRFGKLPSEL